MYVKFTCKLDSNSGTKDSLHKNQLYYLCTSSLHVSLILIVELKIVYIRTNYTRCVNKTVPKDSVIVKL